MLPALNKETGIQIVLVVIHDGVDYLSQSRSMKGQQVIVSKCLHAGNSRISKKKEIYPCNPV